MDDFINKVALGLNLVFSNGIGWPRTRFLVLRRRARTSRRSSTTCAATRCRRRSGTRPIPG